MIKVPSKAAGRLKKKLPLGLVRLELFGSPLLTALGGLRNSLLF
jgi:hypothetical protein